VQKGFSIFLKKNSAALAKGLPNKKITSRKGGNASEHEAKDDLSSPASYTSSPGAGDPDSRSSYSIDPLQSSVGTADQFVPVRIAVPVSDVARGVTG